MILNQELLGTPQELPAQGLKPTSSQGDKTPLGRWSASPAASTSQACSLGSLLPDGGPVDCG